jgi:hypothetical protein
LSRYTLRYLPIFQIYITKKERREGEKGRRSERDYKRTKDINLELNGSRGETNARISIVHEEGKRGRGEEGKRGRGEEGKRGRGKEEREKWRNGERKKGRKGERETGRGDMHTNYWQSLRQYFELQKWQVVAR